MNRRMTLVILMLILALAASIAFADILETPVDCTFKDQEILAVVKELAQQANVEILLDPAIKGKISLELGQVTLKRAIEQIAVLVGGFPGFVGGRIYLASPDPKGPYYLAVLETKVVAVGHLDVKQILQYLAKHPIAQYLTADEETNTISITAPSPIVDYAEAVIKGLDQRQLQVRLEATVIDDSSIGTKDKGVQFKWASGPKNPDGVWTISFANTIFGFTDKRHGDILFNLYSYYAKDKLKIMAQPSVVVQNGKTANISFGRVFYAPIGSVYGGPPAKIEAIKTGISLKVTPRVVKDADGKITDILTDVETSVDDVVGTGSGGISVTTNSRSAKTTLCIKNGETIIIGGLANTQNYKIRSRAPFLGDIPLLGNLFRSSHYEQRQQKVTILITARVVEPEKAIQEAEPAKREIEIRTPAIGVPTPPVESPTEIPQGESPTAESPTY